MYAPIHKGILRQSCVYVFRPFQPPTAAETQELQGVPGTAPLRVCPVTANPGEGVVGDRGAVAVTPLGDAQIHA